MPTLDTDTALMYLKGVGPARAELFAGKGLHTVADLLAYAPFRYEDRRSVKTIARLAPGEMATVLCMVHSVRATTTARRATGIMEVQFADDSGKRLTGKWFHGGYLANVLAPGMRVALFGKVEQDSYLRVLTMMHPEFEIFPEDDPDAALHTGRIVPVYEAVSKITTRVLRILLHRALERVEGLADPLPAHIRERLKLLSYSEALRELHFPSDADVRLCNAFRSPAHWRLIFEEFFWLECGLALKRGTARKATGIAFELNEQIREKIKAMLPFKPTGAQKRVLGEIAKDMAAPHPMSRLLQGDVGSGKTLVAAEAAIIAIENGYQAAVLAPTEILATQHYFYLKRLFEKIGYLTVLLTGSNTAREKQQIKKLIAGGMVPMVIGTHALLEEDVEFHKLGLAIVDEQHRFGVVQRLRLQKKGVTPDVLVMTATPIPRTLALTVYGDLDVSIIDELPPGRRPIQTSHTAVDKIGRVWEFVAGEIAEGRQAYVVYPVIEESETQAMKAATQAHEELSQKVFPNLKVGLLHGRMKPDEKEAAMAAFQRGETDILVATTVIEVGVDVPNATVMVVEQAERFGLAQLHQLRGRVGRGAAQSHCILVTGKIGEAAQERIQAMVDSNDGFYLSELDLRLRGPGEFFGTRQSGMPALRIANILRDREILEVARSEATSFIENPPDEGALREATAYLRDHWQRRYGLAQVG
ncbi:MAG: ATP-dependent DNA helicase RecG [Bryobacteraceae bacterium]